MVIAYLLTHRAEGAMTEGLMCLYTIPLIVEVKEEKTFETEITRLAEKYGQSESLARKIIQCESSGKAEAIGRAAVIGEDHGYFQINSHYHEASAKRLGLDIYEPFENLEYGFYLLKQQGTKPWNASAKCWQNL